MIDYKTFEVEAIGSLYDCGNRLRRRKMMALIPGIRDKIVLEIGFGIGDFWIELKKRNESVYKKYIGLDVSLPNLKKAKELADDLKVYDENTLLVQGDIFTLPFDDKSVEVLICAEVLEHLDDLKAIEEMERVLRKDGYMLITLPYLGKSVKEWGHLRHYDLDMIQSLAKKTDLIIQKINIFGRFHEITWVKFKRVLYRVWGVWKKLSGSPTNYHESGFHRYFIMPLIDILLRLDDLFSSPESILGDRGYLVAVLRKRRCYEYPSTR